MTYVDLINAFELIWWPLVGAAIVGRSHRRARPWQILGLITAGWLILFGLSDGVELYTKAWWKPWWLAVWKGTCIAALVACVAIRLWLLRHHTQQQDPT